MTARSINIEVDGEARGVTVDRLDKGGSRFRVSWDDRTFVVDVVEVDADTLSVIRLDGGTDSEVVRFVETSSPGEVDVHHRGAVVRVGVNRDRLRFGGEPRDEHDGGGAAQIVAPMPGKVVRLLVESGDQVEARQALVVVEAMKMENELTAPRAGRVMDVRVNEGMSVEAGKVLVVIE